MRLLINCSIIHGGGSLQVALSFIRECIDSPENEYHVFLSTQTLFQIDQQIYPDNFRFYHIKNSPSSITHGIGVIRQLKKLEFEIKPDCILTVFGPSYWTPKCIHLIGYALPYYIYPEYFKLAGFSIQDQFLTCIKKFIHRYFLKRNAYYFFTETTDVSVRLSRFLNISMNRVFTVGNTYSHVFNKPVVNSDILPVKDEQEFLLLTISAYYIHKNLVIIERIIPFLKKSDIKIKFILTIPENIFKLKFRNNSDSIINVGPVPLSLVPYLYTSSDALFLPTLLECFSASYPEAMKMKKPILTSDLSFAHDICGEAAEYFDPLNPEDIADKIINLVLNKDRQKELIRKGLIRLGHFETPASRTLKLLDICRNISGNK